MITTGRPAVGDERVPKGALSWDILYLGGGQAPGDRDIPQKIIDGRVNRKDLFASPIPSNGQGNRVSGIFELINRIKQADGA
jgi:hypothetical protein